MPPPAHISLGPLTRTVSHGAKWRDEDLFPAWQEWADETERVLEHLVAQGQFRRFLPRLRDVEAKHRDAALAEARVSFFFFRNGFRILEYDPSGANETTGDLMIQWRETPPIFVEIKAPSWHGELTSRAGAGGDLTPQQVAIVRERLKKPKDIHAEARWIDPLGQALSVVEENGLKKLLDDRPNLIVVADDFFVTPVGLPILRSVITARFGDPAYSRLGALLFLKAQCFDSVVEYRVEFVENESAILRCRLPEEVVRGFIASTVEARQMRRRQAGRPRPQPA